MSSLQAIYEIAVSAFRGKYVKKPFVVLFVICVVGFSFTGMGRVSASAVPLQLTGPQNCGSNAVIKCGAFNQSQLIAGYSNAKNKDVSEVYNSFDISSADVHDIDQVAVAGYVTKSGNVVISSSHKVVANGAVSVGRIYSKGSSELPLKDVNMWVRPTSASFLSNQINAFVIMQNNVFKAAILTSDGSPVNATPGSPTTPTMCLTDQVEVNGQCEAFSCSGTSSGSTCQATTSPSSATVTPQVNSVYCTNGATSGATCESAATMPAPSDPIVSPMYCTNGASSGPVCGQVSN